MAFAGFRSRSPRGGGGSNPPARTSFVANDLLRVRWPGLAIGKSFPARVRTPASSVTSKELMLGAVGRAILLASTAGAALTWTGELGTRPVLDVWPAAHFGRSDNDLPLLEIGEDVAGPPDVHVEEVLQRPVGDSAVLVEVSEDLPVDLVDRSAVIANSRSQ